MARRTRINLDPETIIDKSLSVDPTLHPEDAKPGVDPQLEAKRRQAVEDLLANGVARPDIFQAIRSDPRFFDPKGKSPTYKRVQELIQNCLDRWEKVADDRIVTKKRKAVHRLMDIIRRAKSGSRCQHCGHRSLPQLGVAVQAEKLVADIEGTKEPFRVAVLNIDAELVNAAALALSYLTPTRVEALARAEQEVMEHAVLELPARTDPT